MDDTWELAAWVVLQCIGGVARDLKSPVGMSTLIPRIWMRRELRREAAEKAREIENADRRRRGLSPLSDEDED